MIRQLDSQQVKLPEGFDTPVDRNEAQFHGGGDAQVDIAHLFQNTKWLSAKGYRFRYVASSMGLGHKTPVFFVSGAFQNMMSWSRFAKYFLRQGIPVILADLPGTGEADLLPLDFGLDYLSDTLQQVLDDIGCEHVSIVSASYGTPIAYTFGHKHPARVESLVLAGIMKEIPFRLRLGVEHTLTPLRDGDMETFVNEVLGRTGPQKGNGLICSDMTKPIARRNLAARVLTSQLVHMTPEDKAKYERNTLRLLHHEPLDLRNAPQCRTLVFTGEHDVFTRPDDCRVIASSIQNCTFTTIKDADHLFHIEQFDTTAELLFRFTQQLPLTQIEGVNELEQVGRLDSSAPHSDGERDGLAGMALGRCVGEGW